MRTPAMTRRALRGNPASSSALKGKMIAGLGGAGLGLMLIAAASLRASDDSLMSRQLQDDEETVVSTCATSLLPYRDGSVQISGIQFCEGDSRIGLLILSVLVTIYTFWALAIIVDEGFVTVLDWIVQELQISEDVAGATFMAAGGSAPEFFTNLISVFGETNTGFGTIVGSAVFNVLFVISMSAFFSRPRAEVIRRRDLLRRGIVVKEPWHFEPLPLTWWPLLRDSTVYVVGLAMLATFYFCFQAEGDTCSTNSGAITIGESVFLFLLYVVYCVIMAYQGSIMLWVERKFPNVVPKAQRKIDNATISTNVADSTEPVKVTAKTEAGSVESSENTDSDNNADEEEETAAVEEEPTEQVNEKGDDEEVEEATEGEPAVDENRNSKRLSKRQSIRLAAAAGFNADDVANKRVSFNPMGRRGLIVNEDVGVAEVTGDEEAQGTGEEEQEGENLDVVVPRMRPLTFKGDPERADDKVYRFFNGLGYVLVLPVIASKKTIGFNYDSLSAIEEKRKRSFAGVYAFVMSLVWIGFYTWIMVYCSESFARSLGIPDVILGFTILAAGTSTPDMLSSVFVARLGYGDMAVSSSIGSNIFDILVGLPIPWLLKAAVTGNEIAVPVEASIGISLAVIILMVAVLVAIIMHQDWKLTKRSAWSMLIFYFLFVIVICIASV